VASSLCFGLVLTLIAAAPWPHLEAAKVLLWGNRAHVKVRKRCGHAARLLCGSLGGGGLLHVIFSDLTRVDLLAFGVGFLGEIEALPRAENTTGPLDLNQGGFRAARPLSWRGAGADLGGWRLLYLNNRHFFF